MAAKLPPPVMLDIFKRMRYIFHMVKQQTEEKVFAFMERHEMIQPGDRVVLGLSGGADSVCLLFLLLEYRKKVPFELLAVHVNHGVRGEAAAEDAACAERLCKEQGLVFRLETGDMNRLAAEEKCSGEDAGRRLRYRAFERAAREFGGTKIAVAHNAGDRAETMLLNLFRGSGVKGLRGIEPVRTGSGCITDNITAADFARQADVPCCADVVHPILCLERHEIEEYLRERDISWRTDATNGEDGYTRNRIRHHVLPWAEREICAGAAAHMCRTADILSETEDYLRQQTREALGACAAWIQGFEGEEAEIDVAGFLAYHPAIQKRMLLSLSEELSPTGKDIAAIHVEAALGLFQGEGNRSVDLPFGICFYRRYGKVRAVRGGRKLREPGEPPKLPEISFAEIFVADGEEPPGELFVRNEYTKYFDCDRIKEQPVLRFRRTGDYLTVSDADGNIIHKSLKEYMIGQKIPRELREEVPVLAEGSHVLWVIGYRISEYYKIHRNTKRILQVKLEGD